MWNFEDLENFNDDDDDDDEPAKGDGEDLTNIDDVSNSIAERLMEASYDSRAKIAAASVSDLTKIKGMGKVTTEEIIASAQ